MIALLVLTVVGAAGAGVSFYVSASSEQAAYLKAVGCWLFRSGFGLQPSPIVVSLGDGKLHRVNPAVLCHWLAQRPDWVRDFGLLLIECFAIGLAVALTTLAATPPEAWTRADGHRRGAKLLRLPPILNFDQQRRGTWIAGFALSMALTVAWIFINSLPISVEARPIASGFADIALRAAAVGYGLAFAWKSLSGRVSPAAQRALSLGSALVPRPVELYHFLVAGRTGAGKTQAIQQMLRVAQTRGDRAVIADPDGGYFSRFGSASDVLLNPFDGRSVRWSPFAEIRSAFDYDVLATAVIPPGNTANEEEWRRFGRVLLAASLKELHESGRTSAREMLRLINSAQDNELQTMLAGTNAAGLRRHDAMFHSILGVVTPHIQSWEYLPEPDVAHPPFSIRDWVRQGTPGWLFLPYRDDQLDSLKYLIATWTGLAVAEALSLSEDLNRRLWFVIDELDSLGKVSSLRLAATKLRKHGGVMVAGLQTIAQLRSTYGQDEAQVILSSLANKLILAVGDHETARYFQEELGQREIERSRVVHSSGGGSRGRSSSRSKDIVLEHLVLASELQGLGERRGFLRRAGEPRVHPIQVPLVPMTARLQPFVPAR